VKKFPAMALIEFRDIPRGMLATDAMLKKAPIGFVRCGTISRGRYLTLIGGTTGSVEESFEEGLFAGSDAVLDSVLLADVHPQLHDAILGNARSRGDGAIAIVETPVVSTTVRAAELALKGTPVRLLELRLADDGLSGKGLSMYQGELHDVEAAIDIVSSILRSSGREISYRIIPQPHEAMDRRVATASRFDGGALLELEGEPA